MKCAWHHTKGKNIATIGLALSDDVLSQAKNLATIALALSDDIICQVKSIATFVAFPIGAG